MRNAICEIWTTIVSLSLGVGLWSLVKNTKD